jgi:hypothetical protein
MEVCSYFLFLQEQIKDIIERESLFRTLWLASRCGQLWLAFGWGKCGCLRALTPRVRACVLVAVEMPFSSTFSAAAGATELLRG